MSQDSEGELISAPKSGKCHLNQFFSRIISSLVHLNDTVDIVSRDKGDVIIGFKKSPEKWDKEL